jgi:nucleoid-associated protein EbfC
MGDMGSLLKQAQMMQRELERAKAELADRRVEGTAGGRAVVISMAADKTGVQVEFSKEAVRDCTATELAEMTRIALAGALEEAERISAEEMSKVTGGLDLPGLM